jgi:hypothetical protein
MLELAEFEKSKIRNLKWNEPICQIENNNKYFCHYSQQRDRGLAVERLWHFNFYSRWSDFVFAAVGDRSGNS